MKCVYKSTTYHKKPFYLFEKRSFENQNYHVKLHKLIHTKTEHWKMIKKDEMRVSITSNAKSMFYEFKKKKLNTQWF